MRGFLLGSASLLLATLSVAACGGDDDDATSTSTRTGTATGTVTSTATTPGTTSTATGTSTTATPTSTARPTSYVVEDGDTLSSIAEQFGLTTEELLAVNDIPDPDFLEVGQELVIPPLGAATPTATGTATSTASQ